MDSSNRLLNRRRTVHQILGGGIAADLILWRRKSSTVKILVVIFASWLVFEKSGYTLVSLVSSVLFLLLTILFLWAKSAAIVNRPAPPLPHLHVSEEMANDAAIFMRDRVNKIIAVSEDMALGRDSRMFVEVAGCLLLVSVIGSFTSILTLAYAGLILALTIPAVYERYEDEIDRYAFCCYKALRILYDRFDEELIGKVSRQMLEKKKVSDKNLIVFWF